MRRAVPAAIATLIGLAALLTFKSSPGVPTKAISSAPIGQTTPATSAPPRTGGTTTPTTQGSAADTAPGTTAPATTPATTPATNATTTRTVDGAPYDNPYGTVQVRVTLSGKRITGITELQMPNDRERSAYISEQAGPMLEQEVLQAQSAQIDLIGGATYTSESYAQSLQSALDKARN